MTIATTITILATSFIISVICGPIFIPLLRQLKFGQSIREDGPQSHMKKAGTPTMGGIIFLISIIVTTIFLGNYLNYFTTQSVVLLLVLIGFGLIGFLDDGIKIIFKRNLGLTSKQKFIAQIIISIAAFLLIRLGMFDTSLKIPFTDYSFDIGIFYVGFLIFWLVGFSNAVNLTDGLDGLVAGTASIAFSAFGVIALFHGQMDVALFTFAVTGSLLGFLLFNANPAKVFMGDTGSLALGGALGLVSVLVKEEFLLLIIGFVFVIETLSVIIQVAYYKKTRKRFFKMAPLHHHFELSGWTERKVVAVFWSIALVVALIAVLMEAFI